MAAGWQVQDRRRANLGAAAGVAIREFPLATGEADYLLFVHRKAIGGIEQLEGGTRVYPLPPERQLMNAGHLMIANPFRGEGMVRLFSTHPPMADRIARLEYQAGYRG